MLSVCVKQLRDTLTSAPVYVQPKLSAGAQYIHDKFIDYNITGIAPMLSEIDFDSFTLDDTDAVLAFNSEISRHVYAVGKAAESFNKLKPAVVANTFV
jgi:hypothetical protein